MPKYALINRYAVIVSGKQPFVDWINACDEMLDVPAEMKFKVSMKDMKGDDHKTVYLIDEGTTPQVTKELLKVNRRYKEIFESELYGWVTYDNFWPKDRSYKRFCDWFDVEIQSVITDMSNKPLLG